jgi:hypothetical protein
VGGKNVILSGENYMMRDGRAGEGDDKTQETEIKLDGSKQSILV